MNYHRVLWPGYWVRRFRHKNDESKSLILPSPPPESLEPPMSVFPEPPPSVAEDPPAFAAVVTATKGAHRIFQSIQNEDKNIYQRILLLENMPLRNNFFYGLRHGHGIEEQKMFMKSLQESGVHKAKFIDDFLTIGGGGSGLKVFQLEQLLRLVSKRISNVNLNIVICEKAITVNDEPACVVNSLLTLDRIAKLQKEYHDVLSVTLINNRCLMLQAGEIYPDYRESNKLLAGGIVSERMAALTGKINLRHLVRQPTTCFSTIGFTQPPFKEDMKDKDKVEDTLKQEATEKVWLTAEDLGIQQISTAVVKTLAVLPRELYDAPIMQELEEIVFDSSIPFQASPSTEPKAGIWDRLQEDFEQRSVNSWGELIRVPSENNDIGVFFRVMLNSETVNNWLQGIQCVAAGMKADAISDNPRTARGKKCRELYMMAYDKAPRADLLNW